MAQTRPIIPGITLLCSILAFIIALCCLLAGTNPSTLKGMALYNLNTSMVGPTLLKDMDLPPPNSTLNITSLFKRDVFSDAANKVESAGQSAASSASHSVQSGGADIQKEVNDAKQEAADAVKQAEDAAKNAASTIVSTFINTTIDSLDIQGFYTAHLLTYCEVSDNVSLGKNALVACGRRNKADTMETGKLYH